jgi:predicted RND superfamily exporter protein
MHPHTLLVTIPLVVLATLFVTFLITVIIISSGEGEMFDDSIVAAFAGDGGDGAAYEQLFGSPYTALAMVMGRESKGGDDAEAVAGLLTNDGLLALADVMSLLLFDTPADAVVGQHRPPDMEWPRLERLFEAVSGDVPDLPSVCLRVNEESACYSVSPLDFYQHNLTRMLADKRPGKTLSALGVKHPLGFSLDGPSLLGDVRYSMGSSSLVAGADAFSVQFIFGSGIDNETTALDDEQLVADRLAAHRRALQSFTRSFRRLVDDVRPILAEDDIYVMFVTEELVYQEVAEEIGSSLGPLVAGGAAIVILINCLTFGSVSLALCSLFAIVLIVALGLAFLFAVAGLSVNLFTLQILPLVAIALGVDSSFIVFGHYQARKEGRRAVRSHRSAVQLRTRSTKEGGGEDEAVDSRAARRHVIEEAAEVDAATTTATMTDADAMAAALHDAARPVTASIFIVVGCFFSVATVGVAVGLVSLAWQAFFVLVTSWCVTMFIFPPLVLFVDRRCAGRADCSAAPRRACGVAAASCVRRTPSLLSAHPVILRTAFTCLLLLANGLLIAQAPDSAVGFDVTHLLPPTAASQQTLAILEESFDAGQSNPFFVVMTGAEFATEPVQEIQLTLARNLSKEEEVDGGMTSWMSNLMAWRIYVAAGGRSFPSEDEFYGVLSDFLSSMGVAHTIDLKFEPGSNGTSLVAARMWGFLREEDTTGEYMASRDKVVRIVHELLDPLVPTVIVHSSPWPLLSQFDGIEARLRLEYGLSLLFVAVGALATFGSDAPAVAVMLVAPALTGPAALGLFAAAGISLNAVTELVLAVSLAVSAEYALHSVSAARASLRARDDRSLNDAVLDAWRLSGTPLVAAAASSLGAVAVLLLAPVSVIRDYFAAPWILMSLVSIANGLGLSPLLLVGLAQTKIAVGKIIIWWRRRKRRRIVG